MFVDKVPVIVHVDYDSSSLLWSSVNDDDDYYYYFYSLVLRTSVVVIIQVIYVLVRSTLVVWSSSSSDGSISVVHGVNLVFVSATYVSSCVYTCSRNYIYYYLL